MGRSYRRRQQRTNTPPGTSPRPVTPKPAWRENFDAWGGFPVFGALTLVVLALGVLIYVNRAGSSMGAAAFTPTEYPASQGRVMGDPGAP